MKTQAHIQERNLPVYIKKDFKFAV